MSGRMASELHVSLEGVKSEAAGMDIAAEAGRDFFRCQRSQLGISVEYAAVSAWKPSSLAGGPDRTAAGYNLEITVKFHG